jgi:glycosyltransferase involved in cell wall biosynthesis
VIVTCLFFPFISWRFKKYDLVFCANQPSAILGYIIKLLFRVPYLVYLAQPTRLIYPRPIDRKYGLKLKNKMTVVPHIINIFRPFFFWIDLKSIHSANKFLCNGYYMQEILEQVYGRTPEVCSSGTDRVEQAKGAIQNIELNQTIIRTPYLLVSNRHVPQKKFEYAIEILKQLRDKYQVNINLVISGVQT